MYRKAQTITDIVMVIQLLDDTGLPAAGCDLTLTTNIIAPSGAILVEGVDYTRPVITDLTDGNYLIVFPVVAALKAFTVINAANPYYVYIEDATQAPAYPATPPIQVWITDRYQWELADLMEG